MPRAPSGFRGRFLTDFATRAAYSEGAGPYRIVPRAVAVPRDLNDLLAIVRHATKAGESLTPRGAGSGIPGNNIGRGIVVDLRHFATPLSAYAEGIANVGAGVAWRSLDRAAARRGLRLAPNPSSAFCTIGGMVATNAAGARSLKAGSIRRWVRGVEMVTADAEVGWFGRSTALRMRRKPTLAERAVLRADLTAVRRFQAGGSAELLAGRPEVAARFPRTRKNSSGYALDHYLESGDLLDLIIGSEGTLGIVTRAELTLEQVPVATATVLLALDDLGALPDVVSSLVGMDAAAVELLDRSFLALAAPHIPFSVHGIEVLLLADFERNADVAAQSAASEARDAVSVRCRYVETALTQQDRGRLWAIRHAASPALAALPASRRSLQIVEDGCVPVAALGRYLEGVRTAARHARVEIVAFGHAGDGHLHINALADTRQPDLTARLARLLEEVTALIIELHGTPSGEHGDGRLRAPLLERVYGSELVRLFGLVKRTFDPANILNPGVILPGDRADPTANLKVGPRAAPIPEEVESRLREIERSGAWGTAKTELA